MIELEKRIRKEKKMGEGGKAYKLIVYGLESEIHNSIILI